LDKSLRHPGVLESINHENSHTFEMPILSQLRNETLDNLRVLPGLNYLYNINLASTDPQIPVSISVGVCKFWVHMFVMANFIMCFSRFATWAHESCIPYVTVTLGADKPFPKAIQISHKL
jgi:hypothetical protein